LLPKYFSFFLLTGAEKVIEIINEFLVYLVQVSGEAVVPAGEAFVIHQKSGVSVLADRFYAGGGVGYGIGGKPVFFVAEGEHYGGVDRLIYPFLE